MTFFHAYRLSNFPTIWHQTVIKHNGLLHIIHHSTRVICKIPSLLKSLSSFIIQEEGNFCLTNKVIIHLATVRQLNWVNEDHNKPFDPDSICHTIDKNICIYICVHINEYIYEKFILFIENKHNLNIKFNTNFLYKNV